MADRREGDNGNSEIGSTSIWEKGHVELASQLIGASIVDPIRGVTLEITGLGQWTTEENRGQYEPVTRMQPGQIIGLFRGGINSRVALIATLDTGTEQIGACLQIQTVDVTQGNLTDIQMKRDGSVSQTGIAEMLGLGKKRDVPVTRVLVATKDPKTFIIVDYPGNAEGGELSQAPQTPSRRRMTSVEQTEKTVAAESALGGDDF